jgi:cobalt/nickel transport system permease protein
MTLAFRHRPIPRSPLARWDARWKLAAILLATCGVAALDHPAPAAAALGLAASLLVVARLPLAWVCARLSLFAFAALPFLLVLPFTLAGEGWDLGPVHVSEHGLTGGAAVFCRGVAIGGLALLLLATAPIHHTLAAAHKLRVPGLLVQLTLFAHRYTFLLAEEFRRLRIAMRTRGFRVRATRHGYRSLGHATGALLVRGSDRAEAVTAAARCRGFDGTFRTLATFRTTPADVLGFLTLLAATIALVTWDRALEPSQVIKS